MYIGISIQQSHCVQYNIPVSVILPSNLQVACIIMNLFFIRSILFCSYCNLLIENPVHKTVALTSVSFF